MNEEWNEKNLDYDKLLNDWADSLYEKKDEIECRPCDMGSFKHGYCSGFSEGLVWALAQLSMREGRKSTPFKLE